MAHIQKRIRGHTRWIARTLAPDGGERTRTFDRKVDAEHWLTTIEATKLRGEWIDPERGRVRFRFDPDDLDAWLGEARVPAAEL